jgi:hypothetical protein
MKFTAIFRAICFREVFHNYLIKKVIPLFWPLISILLTRVHRNRLNSDVNLLNLEKVLLLVSSKYESLGYTGKGIDLVRSVESWIAQVMPNANIVKRSDLYSTSLEHGNCLVVVTNDWLANEAPWRKLFNNIREILKFLRRNNSQVWAFLADTFDCEILVPASILVAYSGGTTIIQQNTARECRRLGIINPAAPVFWTLTRENVRPLRNPVAWSKRENLAIYAQSGDQRRIQFLGELSNRLAQNGWKLLPTKANALPWEEYLSAIKKGKVSLTTNWMQNQYRDVYPNILRKRIPETTTTHRVWENFAAGIVSINNETKVLQYYGFIPGIHYLTFAEEHLKLLDSHSLENQLALEKIALEGQKKFQNLLSDKGKIEILLNKKTADYK